ncbi:uncharacterized protein A1O9_12567 [Exophiala aquamarina CBS 119918]|uniref:Uncharacterized protein n=1 Tax=Exophiala aquamarina CBS 119918 TaxID=1182545 RepID=A0A072NWK1_9EURO|nr:uncharacterized protein A1O9_12567 [Exophiala aquamarina CBS 119918]KEF51418.1 hypothetical protein A1O9_12567 [Exophiala aquamarina CBS 119918]
MVDKAIVLPIACLSGICGAMLIFIWWFFPKWYKKGLAQDRRDMDDALRERREYIAAEAAARRAANSSSDAGSVGDASGEEDLEAQRRGSKAPAVTAQTYRPPPIAVF